MKRGEIWLVALPVGIGSEQYGVRPCVIVQNDIGNKHSPTTVVCPITTKDKAYSATHVFITCLPKPSIIMTEQVRVVDKLRCKRKLLTLDVETMKNVSYKMLLTFGI